MRSHVEAEELVEVRLAHLDEGLGDVGAGVSTHYVR